MSQPVVRVVWHSGTDRTDCPPEMGIPRADQLQGTPLDQLAEIAGRISYDSLGRGRSSEKYHEHIKAEGHLAVLRHANLTFGFDAWSDQDCTLGSLIGRPGVALTSWNDDRVRFTCNMQAALEWFRRRPVYYLAGRVDEAVGRTVRRHFAIRSPLAFGPCEPFCELDSDILPGFAVEEARLDTEVYASVFFSGVSRAFTHELITHGYLCSRSQRSGRYCDDSEMPWVMHPDLRDAVESGGPDGHHLGRYWDGVVLDCRGVYGEIAVTLERLLKAKGMDARDALKQARSAARGVLGNALGTEILFGAPLSQWKFIFSRRCATDADREIRDVMGEVRRQLAALHPSHFPDAPVTLPTSPSPTENPSP